MYIYENEGKLCIVLGEEGKKQIPAETPDVVIEKVDGKVSVHVGETTISDEEKSEDEESDDQHLSYGVVEKITDIAIVKDANSKNPVVTCSDATLNWYAADPSIGRMNDGWWIGIKITAPETMTKKEDFIKDDTYVKYQTGVGSGWSVDKNFWNAQDSNINSEDTPRYLTLWGQINEQYLQNAISAGKNIEYKWQFDWNMDGEFEQLVTLHVDPSNIILNKDNQQVYPIITD